jgi:phenylpropionate dioxygenase-like ring-hydroxylating dioxygenase large terminal subunit
MNIQSINGSLIMEHVRDIDMKLSDSERGGLPAWTYFSDELLQLERRELFRKCWQLACHVNDVREPGDYQCFDMVGERALIVRGHDGELRAFHNVCRHRGSRVVAHQAGHCKSALVCPFHGWSYNLDGTLRAVPQKRTLPVLDPQRHGLVALEHEIWNGFVFVRFMKSDQPPVRELMAPYAEEVERYRIAAALPLGHLSKHELRANWKAVRDVDNEGYHVPIAHPSLQDLYGGRYRDGRGGLGMGRSFAPFNEAPDKYWSVRLYKQLLPEVADLPESHRRAWLYIGLFPNLVLMLYPDRVGFYQEYPLAVGRTEQRFAYYGHPDGRREMKLARYLSYRIDRITSAEDDQLIEWSWEAMQSSSFAGFILSDLESGVRFYHDQLRRVLPVMALERPPAPGQLEAVNSSLRSVRNADVWERELAAKAAV